MARKPADQKKKNPLAKIFVVLVIIGALIAVATVAARIPDTMELERKMDTAASAITTENITMLAQAILTHAKAVNQSDARLLAEEMIQISIEETVTRTDFRALQAIAKTIEEQESWKPHVTDAHRKRLESAKIDILKRLAEEQKLLNEFRLVANRLIKANVPLPTDVAYLADFQVPPGIAECKEALTAATYSGAVALKATELADSFLARAADPEALKTGVEEECKECKSSGQQNCRNCIGDPGKCITCKGTAKMMITQADARAFTQVEQDCYRCKGTGQCVSCDGTGKQKCAFCKGKGKWISSALALRTMKQKLRDMLSAIDRQEAEYNQLKSEYGL